MILIFRFVSINPRPIRFGSVPTGMPRPPIDAANAVINISAVPNAGGIRLSLRIASEIGNIIAVVAVLDIDNEMKAVAIPNAASSHFGLVPTLRMIPNAMRWLSPCYNIASTIKSCQEKENDWIGKTSKDFLGKTDAKQHT